MRCKCLVVDLENGERRAAAAVVFELQVHLAEVATCPLLGREFGEPFGRRADAQVE